MQTSADLLECKVNPSVCSVRVKGTMRDKTNSMTGVMFRCWLGEGLESPLRCVRDVHSDKDTR